MTTDNLRQHHPKLHGFKKLFVKNFEIEEVFVFDDEVINKKQRFVQVNLR